MSIRFTWLFPILMLVACGDANNGSNNGANNGADNGECRLQMPLDDAVQETLMWDDSNGCAGATSGTLVTLTFGVIGGESVAIGFSDFAFGETGATSAYVRYSNGAGAEWTAQDCSIEITQNEVIDSDPDFGDTYALAGTGSCTEPAGVTQGGGDQELSIGDFDWASNQVPGPAPE